MFKTAKKTTIISAVLLLTFSVFGTQSLYAYSSGKPVLRGAASTNIRLEGDTSFSNSDRSITVSLRDSDIKQAIRMFADKAGMNVVFHKNIKDDIKITLDLVDVPLGEAIKMITQMAELTYVVDSNTVMILKNEDAKKLDISKKQMSIVPLKYIDATSAANFLNANVFKKSRPGLSNSYVASANPTKNELILFGEEEDFKLAQKVLNKIDIKPYISTYKVNHTTPKEMAKMICESLFNEKSTSSEKISATWSEDLELGGAYQACVIGKIDESGTDADGGKLLNLKGSVMRISYIPGVGNIQVVGGSPEQIQLISDFIAYNDRKQPQAYIEMSIIELSENGSKEFQNTWNIYSNFFTGSIGGNGIQTANNYPFFWLPVDTITNGALNDYGGRVRGLVIENADDIANYYSELRRYNTDAKYYEDVTLPAWKEQGGSWAEMPQAPKWEPPTVSNDHAAFRYAQQAAVTQQINYVVQNGKGRVLSNPKVVVTNGKKTKIDLTADIIKSVKSEILKSETTIGNATQKTYEIGSGENGIKIELVPFISPDGYVSMNIKPEYSTVAEAVYSTNDDGVMEQVATLMRERNMELSNIRVKDGETLVLGGLIQEYESKTVSKPPILGDIPVIGFLFRNSSTTNQKSELVILITPRIIKDNEDLVSAPHNL